MDTKDGSDARRCDDIIAFILAKFPEHKIEFVAGLNKGWNCIPHNWNKKLSTVSVFDLTLMEIGGPPTEIDLYFEVDGNRYFINETDVAPPTVRPLCSAVQAFRKIWSIAP